LLNDPWNKFTQKAWMFEYLYQDSGGEILDSKGHEPLPFYTLGKASYFRYSSG